MSKVLVDRELLDRWADKLEGADSAGYGWEDLLASEIRGACAQPAEAEGVERWSELRALAESAPGENWKAGNAYGKPFIPTYQVIADTVDGPCVILEGNKNFIEQAKAAVTFAAAANPAAVRELIAALSAVTAERDRLRDEVARLESAWHVETMNRKDGIIARQEQENDRAKAERDQLRAEVEALRTMAQRANILLHQIADSGYDDDSIDALTCWLEEHPGAKLFARVSAMAAKEA